MSKEIIPIKLIIDLNPDGTFRDGILQYQMRIDGELDTRKFYTVGIKNGINIPDIEEIIKDSSIHAKKAEQIIAVDKKETEK